MLDDEDEDQDGKLEMILQMLEPYAQDPLVQDRLLQIKKLQGALRNGTA